MLLSPLDVIWIYDDCIRPPGPKMVVCVCPELGLFFRINSEGKWQTPVPLAKSPDHLFLSHDSYLECGEPLELDDYVIEESINRKGIIGQVGRALVPQIVAAVEKAVTLSQNDKDIIKRALLP